jgi:hypothetical protein
MRYAENVESKGTSMTDKEAMKLALFALDIVKIHYTQSRHINEAIAALKERLAQPEQTEVQQLIALVRAQQITIDKLEAALAQPEQEPVAWMWDVNNGGGYTSRGVDLYQTSIPFAKHTPLYTIPPQRTEQERDEILQAITDPENQPSQFGTVTLEYHQEKMKMWEDLFDRMRENFERISDKVLAERKPLTDDEIWKAIRPFATTDQLCKRLIDISMDEYRAIEAAHGIKENT